MAETVELDVNLRDGLTGPARAEARALQQLEQQMARVQRSAAGASQAQAHMGQAMRSSGASAGVGDIFSANVMADALQSLSGGGKLASIGGALGTAIGGPMGAAIGSAAGGTLDAVVAQFERMISLAYGFGKALFSAAASGEVLRGRITSAFEALRGAGQGAAGLADVQRIAREMGTSAATTFDGIRALSAAGFKAPDAERWFKRMQDLSAIGIDQQTQGRVVLAMSQIKGAGTLQGDELRQLQETGLNIDLIWQGIAKRLGKTTTEAKKLKEQGKVSADVALAAIEDAVMQMTGGKGAGEARKGYLATTFGGAIEQVQAFADQAQLALATKTSGAFSKLGGAIREAMTYLESPAGMAWLDHAAAMVDMIAAGLTLAGRMTIAFARGLGAVDSGPTEDLAGALRRLSEDKTWVDSMQQFGVAVAVMGGVVASAVGAVSSLVSQLAALADALDRVIPTMGALQGMTAGNPYGGGIGGGLAPQLMANGGGGGGGIRIPQVGGFGGMGFGGFMGQSSQPSTVTNQSNSFSISVQGGSDAGELAGIIQSAVKREIKTLAAQLGV